MASCAVVPRFETYAAIAAGFSWGGFWEAGDERAEDFAGSPFATEGRVAHGSGCVGPGTGGGCGKDADDVRELEDCRGGLIL